jgi:hypothetical protein
MPRILRALRPEECCNQVRCQIAIFVGLVSATLSLLPFGFADPKGASVLSPKYEVFCCDQNGPPARREEGAYLNPYVTDEQRGRRPIFIATLRAGASWLFFRVARLTRMTEIWACSGHVYSPRWRQIACHEQATARRMARSIRLGVWTKQIRLIL